MLRNYVSEVTVLSEFLRRTWAQIHLDRLKNNAAHIKSRLSDGCRLMAVIKANAYGHGAVLSAQALSDSGVDWFGVSSLDEAVELRRAGCIKPILVISYTPASQATRLAAYQVTQTVLSLQHAQELSQAAVAAGVKLRIHIKLDTGMSRVGFVCHDVDNTAQVAADVVTACQLPGLVPEGIFTHFASADEADDGGYTQLQFERFMRVVELAESLGVHFSLRHCCNSAATLRFPHMHLDMVRAGIILYGIKPDRWMGDLLTGIRPVMELKTTVSMVKELPADTPLSYGRTYTTESCRRVATVPIGYADGYLRQLSNRASMLIHGQRAPQIGRVCMDQCMLDVTGIPHVEEGSVVTVFGEDGEAILPVDELASLCGTISYELVCLLNRRVPRVYYDKDCHVALVNYLLK